MKRFKHKIIRAIFYFLLMTACFILIDLYTPAKTILIGNEISRTEFWSHIKLDYGDWIIISIIAISGLLDKKENSKVKSRLKKDLR